MKLLVYKENEIVQELILSQGGHYTIGRSETCQVVLDKLPGISREHFELEQNENGQWQVNVLSSVMKVLFNGEEVSNSALNHKDEFILKPYRFILMTPDLEGSFGNSSSDDQASSDQIDFEAPTTNQEAHFSDIEVTKNQSPPAKNDPQSEPLSDDERTDVQSFNGAPYLKIVGKSGKKSEFFRLEGNLWVIGADKEASVYINDDSVAARHFELSKTEKGFFIADNGSPIGTHLNGQKLPARKLTRILSGDIIVAGETSLQFELRDQAFKRKVSNIPLQMYKNPLVFFDQEVAMVSLDQEDAGPGAAEQLSSEPVSASKSKKTNLIRFVAAALIVLIAVVNLTSQNDDEQKTSNIGADPFGQLTPPEKRIVVQSHRLAKQLFLAKNYELALVQLDKLHSILPSYKDSKEIEEYCINSRELKRQRAMIEKQRQEEQQVANAVQSYIAQCNQTYATSDDVDGVRACLSPATELDPNNPAISQLITDVTARQEEKRIREKIAEERRDKVRRGKELFRRARSLHKQSNYLKAMEAYENHIHSGLPDPKRLVKTSKRHLAAIEAKIRTKKDALVGQAQTMYTGTKLKEAIYLARQAQKVDPYDPKISSFLFKVERELSNRMKSVYLDSVIEEQFGNLEASRVKWEAIVKSDVSDGKYYRKAKRKLKQYGFTY